MEIAVAPDRAEASKNQFKPSWIAYIAIYLAFSAVVFRTLAVEEIRHFLPQYLSGELAYLLLFTLLLWKPNLPGWMLHLYFAVQSTLVLWMLSLHPEFDFIVNLFLLLTFHAALFFSGRTRWIWVGFLIFLTGGPLIYYLGILEGLSKSLTTIAGEIVLPAYLIAAQEIHLAQRKSQEMLSELQDTHQQLKLYNDQVEELASVQERNRLVRELHDTVSQLIFSISLTVRSAQLLLDQEPSRVGEILKRLQTMTSDALSQLRSFISQLHPPQNT